MKIHPHNEGELYYDIVDDWELIESSVLKQYGIRLRAEKELSWSEFCSLLSGIMPDTPLGAIVSIRAEKDINVLKNFSDEQKKIRNDWLLKKAKKLKENPKAYREYWSKFQDWAKSNFST